MRYGADDPMPIGTTLMVSMQYLSLAGAYVVYPVIVLRAAQVPAETAASVVALSFLAMGIATILQAIRGAGCGFLCPTNANAIYIGPSLVAVQVGGLPLVFGMAVFAGGFELVLSFMCRRIRPAFPPEVCGLVILLVGLGIGEIASRSLVSMVLSGDTGQWMVALATFTCVSTLAVWGRGSAARYAVLIGLVVGYAVALLTGVVTEADRAVIAAAPLLGLPTTGHLGLQFDISLVPVFAIAATAAAIKAAALVILARRSAGPGIPGDAGTIMARGIRGDGLASIVAGLLGTLGLSPASSTVSIISASGIASRRIAWAMGAFCVVLALLPSFALVVARLPQPILAGMLLFAGSLVLVNGMQMAVEAKLDTRRSVVVGLGVFAALAAQGLGGLRETLPPALGPILTSPFVLGSTVALLANLVLRIRSAREVRFAVAEPGRPGALDAAWPADADLPPQARPAVAALLAELPAGSGPTPVAVRLRFDEFGLKARLSYPGAPPDVLARGRQPLAAFAARHGLRHLRGRIGPDGTRLNLAMAW